MSKEDDNYSDVYGFTRPPDELITKQLIKTNPHMPPWIFKKSEDFQTEVIYALDTGELVWVKDPKQRKGPATPKQERDWKSIGCGTLLFVAWTLLALYTVIPSLAAAEGTGLPYLIKLGWAFVAWFLPIVILRGGAQT